MGMNATKFTSLKQSEMNVLVTPVLTKFTAIFTVEISLCLSLKILMVMFLN